MMIYVSDEDMETLREVAAERGCPVEDLAEAAVSEACLAVRRDQPREVRLQGRLKLVGIDAPLDPFAERSLSRRCEGAPVCGGGECIACDAVSGEACRRPREGGPPGGR